MVHSSWMPAIQFIPVRFRRGDMVHANLLCNPHGTECGKSLQRGVIVVDRILTCPLCIAKITCDRLKANRKSRKKTRR